MDNKVFRGLSADQKADIQREIQRRVERLLKEQGKADPFRAKFPRLHACSQYRTGFQVMYNTMRLLGSLYERGVSAREVWDYMQAAPSYSGRAHKIQHSTFQNYMRKGEEIGLWRRVPGESDDIHWRVCVRDRKEKVNAYEQLFWTF